MNRQYLILAVWVVIVLLGATACGSSARSDYTPEPTVVDRGLAYGIPCKPPCWEGLTPGVSTEEDVHQVLENLRESGHIPSFFCTTRLCGATDEKGYRNGSLILFLENENLAWLHKKIDFDFEVDQLIDLLGEPTWVFPSEMHPSSCTCEESDLGPLASGDYTSLLYPEQGAAFVVRVPPKQIGCVCPDMEIIALNYFPPMPSLSEYLYYWAAVLYKETPAPAQTTSDYVHWHGYGPGYVPTRP